MTNLAKMCTGKVRYETSQAAGFFGVTDGLRVYCCPVCHGWHLTSLRVRRPKPVRR